MFNLFQVDGYDVLWLHINAFHSSETLNATMLLKKLKLVQIKT